MDCSICYEKFFRPKTQEELKTLFKENVKCAGDLLKFQNLLITRKNNSTYSCSTPNCSCIICGDCLHKMHYNGKSVEEYTEDDMPEANYLFECPLCRQIDWKFRMNKVFFELQQKVLSEEDFGNLFMEKILFRI